MQNELQTEVLRHQVTYARQSALNCPCSQTYPYIWERLCLQGHEFPVILQYRWHEIQIYIMKNFLVLKVWHAY